MTVALGVLGGGGFEGEGLLLLSLSLAFREKLRGLVQICRREEGTGDSSPLPFPSQQCSV